jgi:hypothetical protein
MEINFCVTDAITIDDILKYRNNNTSILDELVPYIDKNANNKKYRNNNSTWKRDPPAKTNWLLNNKLNQTETTKLYSSMNDLLNKVSDSNFEIVSTSMSKLNISSREHMTHLVNIIIEESIKNHRFTSLYAKICHKLMPFYVVSCDEDEDKIHFRELLLTRCQEIFEENIKNIQDIDKMKLLGLAGIVSELYNLNILSSSVLLLCFNELFNNINKNPPNVINALCYFMTIAGKEYFKRDSNNASKCIGCLIGLVESDKELNRREKYLIMDLVDLKKKEKWI